MFFDSLVYVISYSATRAHDFFFFFFFFQAEDGIRDFCLSRGLGDVYKRQYPLIGKYLAGTTASSLFEAKLGHEEMPGTETHIYAPAYSDEDFSEIIKICDHIVFNSFSQWNKYKNIVSGTGIECGIRINPEYSEIETDIYNPCFKGSRMGVTLRNFEHSNLDGISGLHFHTMCEQNSDVLWRTVQKVDEKFGKYIKNMKWINMGGGHHITREDYDIELLCKSINYFSDKYGVAVYLEPGEAVALNAGYLTSSVMDIINNEIDIAILDTSAACHMPDVLEMPYRPNVIDAGNPGEYPYTCLLYTSPSPRDRQKSRMPSSA